MEKLEPKEKIKCLVCGEMFPIITPSHLMKKHQMSLKDYKEKFPEAPISSAQYKAKQKFLKGSLFTKEEKGEPIIDEIDLGNLTLKTESKIDTEIEDIKSRDEVPEEKELFKELISKQGRREEVIVKELGIRKLPRIQPQPQVTPDKKRILEFLQKIFPATSVINNFMIEKFHRDGTLEYQFVTDIAITSKNIDLEFTKCFWHNSQDTNPNRKHKLERDGWTIIEIREPSPPIDVIKSYLKNRKLI